MWGLFKGELSRFRRWALAFAGVHLAVLIFYTRITDLLQQPQLVYRLWGGIYFVVGLLFGLYQLGGYRKGNAWVYLLHRPLPPGRIFLAVAGASATLFLAAVVLPPALVLLAVELFSDRVVDARHYLLPLTVPGLVLSGYLVGCYTLLHTRRSAALIAVLPALFLVSQAQGARVLLLHALVVAWLGLLTYRSFRPDLSAHPRRPLTVLAAALPLQMAVYLLLLGGGSVLFQMGAMFVGVHPLAGTPKPGGYIEADRARSPELLLAGLGDGRDPRTQLWREQLRITETWRLEPSFDELPERHQLTNVAPLELEDREHGVQWTFSHDTGRFVGVDLAQQTPRGQLPAGGAPLAEPPLILGDGWLMTHHVLYRYDGEGPVLHPRVTLDDTERFAAPPLTAGESVVVLTDRRLLFFDARDFSRETRPLAPQLQLALPGPVPRLDRVDLAELVDGYLVSFTYGRGVHDGETDGWQATYVVDTAAPPQLVHRRDLVRDFPLLFQQAEVWVSPAMFALRRQATWALSEPNPLSRSGTLASRPPMPEEAWILAAVLALVAALLTAWLAWLQPMTLSRRLCWIAAAALVGLPALLSFLLLNPRPELHPVLAPTAAAS